jgi:alpha/beta superfamily hydrolase
VHGDRDEFGHLNNLRSLVARLSAQTDVRLEIISDADHFFEGRLDEMKRVITEWMKERM